MTLSNIQGFVLFVFPLVFTTHIISFLGYHRINFLNVTISPVSAMVARDSNRKPISTGSNATNGNNNTTSNSNFSKLFDESVKLGLHYSYIQRKKPLYKSKVDIKPLKTNQTTYTPVSQLPRPKLKSLFLSFFKKLRNKWKCIRESQNSRKKRNILRKNGV